MPETKVRRARHELTVSVVKDTCESAVFSMHDYADGHLHMPAAWTAAAVGFKACDEEAGTYVPVYNHSGQLVKCASIGPSMIVTMPPKVTSLGFVRLWSIDGSEADVNQGADRTLKVAVKG